MNASIHRALIVLALTAPTAMAVSIETVPVGNVGNPPDPYWLDSQGPLGDVAYEYRIGKYEVTNAQFVEFLNAKAQTDPHHLYDFDMTGEVVGGIIREGPDGSYSYSAKPDMANKPVNFVSQYTAMRFANWMHNGQGNGDTEIGSYNLQAGYPARYDRVPGATWVLPTENEWYKAAYYDPRTQADGGPPGDDHYWLFPTRSDIAPTPATANSVGDINNPGYNVANYFGGANWNGTTDGNLTSIGTAGPESVTYYGTYDQAGNLGEWDVWPIGQRVSGLGGAYLNLGGLDASLMTAQARYVAYVSGIGPDSPLDFVGFRMAYVPEPSSWVLAALALLTFIVGRNRLDAARVLIVILLTAPMAMAVTMETVPVGNPGNGPDPFWLDDLGPLGSVNYSYRIGTYEVTNSQYAEFLNAKAASDPLALYDADMGSKIFGGIARSGADGSYTYAARPNMGDKPVNYVSMWSVLRFANWMHNGQGAGDTESGSYTLLGGAPSPTNFDALERSPGATWVLPRENEWYKAAYYDPRTEAQGGPPGDDHYWLYPTQSDDVPTLATANSVGEITNPGFNVANYGGGADWNGTVGGNVTTAGSAGPLSTTYYGTFDQAGNVAEWNHRSTGQPWNGLGGVFLSEPLFGDAALLTALCRNVAPVSGFGPTLTEDFAGFRLVYVPEPSSLMLAALGPLVFVVGRNRLDAARAV